jgi:hypothetical protein
MNTAQVSSTRIKPPLILVDGVSVDDGADGFTKVFDDDTIA